jgi:hypothetical protein
MGLVEGEMEMAQIIVKPLDWQRYPDQGTMTEGLNERREYVSRALLPWGALFLMKSSDGIYTLDGAFGEDLGEFRSSSDATWAAQNEFTDRIRSVVSLEDLS